MSDCEVALDCVCDICNKGLGHNDGYLLTTQQVVSNPVYWEYMFHAWSRINGAPATEQMKGTMAEQQARQRTPWLACAECATRLGEATPQAQDYARRWWSSGRVFAPPGSGPAPLSAVRMTRTATAIDVSGMPRPSRVLIYGRGFLPKKEEIETALQGLAMSKDISRELFLGIAIEAEMRMAVDREAFFAVVDEVRQRALPSTLVLDCLCMDQRTGHDTAVLALWEGKDANLARRCLARQADVAAEAVHAFDSLQKGTRPTKRPFLSAWTIWCFIPWLNWIAWAHAAIRARSGLYAAFVIPYIVPLVLLLTLSDLRPGKEPPLWVVSFNSILWLGCIAHVFLMRKQVNEKITARLRQHEEIKA